MMSSWSCCESRSAIRLPRLLLIALICWQALLPASQAAASPLRAATADSSWLRLDQAMAVSRQHDPSELFPDAQIDVWLNATYAFGGSALSNGLIVLSVVLMGLVLEATSPDAAPYLDIAGPGSIGLIALSAAGTPMLMHLWSPEARGELYVFSLIGSLAASGAVLLAMLPLSLLFNQASFSDTFYTLLPPAFITAVLLQGLGSAWGHELGESIGGPQAAFGPGVSGPFALRTEPQGLVLLSHRWQF